MTSKKHSDLMQQYQDAHERAVVLEQSTPGILHISGLDALNLLNRMSTNDLLGAAARFPLTTVFTNANARIVEIATVIPETQTFTLLCWHDTPAILRDWLSGYIFFQDDVRFLPSPIEWKLFDVFGPQALAVLETYFRIQNYRERELLQIEGGVVWGEPLGDITRIRLLCTSEFAHQIVTQAGTNGRPVRAEQLNEILRIEAGQPRFGSEITSETIPLEVGLWDLVSFSKGCYIGQEIIARMESRGKLARTIVGLQSESNLVPGTNIYANGQPVGAVTSSVLSPRFGWIGLGSLKPRSWDGTAQLTAGEDIKITVRELPFR
jgi:tRNA-modifying protein YgfZ